MAAPATPISRSGTSTTVPRRAKRSRTAAYSSASTGASGTAKASTPRPTSAGVFGSTQNTGVSGYAARTSACVARARIETTTLAAPAISSATASSWAGLWARITRSARSATSRLPSAWPPSSSASALARPEPESLQSTGSPQPRASADAMLPEPMKPTCMAGEYRGRRPRVAGADHRERSAHAERATGLAAREGAVRHPDGAAGDLGAGRGERRAGARGTGLWGERDRPVRRLGRADRRRVCGLDRVAAGLHAPGELELVRGGAGDDRGAAARDDAPAADQRELDAPGRAGLEREADRL